VVRGCAVFGCSGRRSGRRSGCRASGRDCGWDLVSGRSLFGRSTSAGGRFGAGDDVSRVRTGTRFGGTSPSRPASGVRSLSAGFRRSSTSGMIPGIRTGARSLSLSSFPKTTFALGGRRRIAVEQSVGAG
jgi:hypothetical protein